MNWYDHVLIFFEVMLAVFVSMVVLGVLDKARKMAMAQKFIDELQQEIKAEKDFIDIVSKFDDDDDDERRF